jgi:hypothetical protein
MTGRIGIDSSRRNCWFQRKFYHIDLKSLRLKRRSLHWVRRIPKWRSKMDMSELTHHSVLHLEKGNIHWLFILFCVGYRTNCPSLLHQMCNYWVCYRKSIARIWEDEKLCDKVFQ